MPAPNPYPRTIMLRGEWDPLKYEEKYAASQCLPGHLLDVDANDKFLPVVGGAGTNGRMWIAIEDGFLGMTIDDTTGYATGQLVRAVLVYAGEHYLMRLKAGENVTRTTKLVAENGLVKAGTSPATGDIVGFPRDPLDNSLGGTFDWLAVVAANR